MADECIKRDNAKRAFAVAFQMPESMIDAVWIQEVLDAIPAADVAPVVRCKDCKYAEIASMGHLSVCKHPKGMIDPNPNSYCSYGERRTNDD